LGLLVSEGTFGASADGETFKLDSFFTGLVTSGDTFLLSVEPTFGATTTARGLAGLADTSELNELGDFGIEGLTIGEISESGIGGIKFFTGDGVLLLLSLGTGEHSADGGLLGFHISFGDLTLGEVILGLEVIFSLFGVVLNDIAGISVTIISLESVLVSLLDVLESNWLVEDWASLDAHNLGGRVGVLGVLEEVVLLVTHQARGRILALEATFGALDTRTGVGSGHTLLALHAAASIGVLASMAVLVGASLALFASGSVVFDTLGISRVDLNLTGNTSGTSGTGTVSELEALGATLALIRCGTTASLTRGMALGTGLSFDFLDVSIVILDLGGLGSFDFVHTETASGALTFVHTALLTIRLALVAGVGFLVVEESHSLFVGWAFPEAHTDQFSDLLLLSFDLSSGFRVGLGGCTNTLGVPDLVHHFIVGEIGSLLVRLCLTSGIDSGKLGLLGSRDLLLGEHSSLRFGFHGSDHFEVHVHKFFTTWWGIDLIEHFLGILVRGTHGFLSGGENTITFAGEATSLGTVNTFSAGEVALLASTFIVNVAAWGTDLALGSSGAHSAVGNSASLTG